MVRRKTTPTTPKTSEPANPLEAVVAALERLPELKAVRAAIDTEDAHVVGGIIRDALLVRESTDLDIAIGSDPAPFAKKLATRLHGTAVELDAARGTWRVALKPTGERTLTSIDLTRTAGNDVVFDLFERDFTMNAMAVSLHEPRELIDPRGEGVIACRRRELSLRGNSAFKADPVRLLRAARFQVEIGLRLSEPTRRAMARDAALLAGAASERQRHELMLMLRAPYCWQGLQLLDRTRVLDALLPELVPGRGFVQPEEHTWDVLRHQIETVRVVDSLFGADPVNGWALGGLTSAELDRLGVFWSLAFREEIGAHFTVERVTQLKLAGLLHDIAKPETMTVENGRTRFFGHADRGAEIAAAALQRLRFSKREVRDVSFLVKHHLRPGQLAAPGEAPTRRAISRFFRDLGELALDVLLLQFVDAEATLGPRSKHDGRVRHVGFIGAMLREREILGLADGVPMRLVTGRDIMQELRLEPGPVVGRILSVVDDAFSAGDVWTREQALALARRVVAEAQRPS